jgi:hypothetical protein
VVWCGRGAEICWLSLEHVWSMEAPSIPTTDGRGWRRADDAGADADGWMDRCMAEG